VTTLRDKLIELEALTQVDQEYVEAHAFSFLERAGDWPVSTQVSLNDVAYLLAGLLAEPRPHVRKIMVSDSLKLKSELG
jgi:predicted translin family RNA/ssDNA-binding protein